MPRRGSCCPVLEMPPTAVEEIRTRALERLYERREAVDALIRSFEDYAESESHRAPCIEITAWRKYS